MCYLQYDTTAALCSRHYDHVRSACDVYSTGGDSNERFGIYFFFIFSNETLGRVGSAACRRHARRFVVFVFQKPRRSFHIRFDWFEVNNFTRLQIRNRTIVAYPYDDVYLMDHSRHDSRLNAVIKSTVDQGLKPSGRSSRRTSSKLFIRQ